MEIHTEEVGDVRIVSLNGSLDTNTSPEAESELNSLIENGITKIVISCEKLDYMSSAGLRILLSTTKKTKSKGGACHICSLNEIVQEVFDISGFSMIFSVYKTPEEAVKGFS
jgi:anti-sigma B factor antagonist